MGVQCTGIRTPSLLSTLSVQMKTHSHNSLRVAIIAVTVLSGLVVLFVFDPSRHGFYPKCLFHSLTGLHCPGCGSTRALYEVVHGHVGAAFALNPLIVVLVPFLLCGWVVQKLWQKNLQPAERLFSKPGVAWTIAVVVIAFGILRNIPIEPFTWLAP